MNGKMRRREMLKRTGAALMGAGIATKGPSSPEFVSRRPPVDKRAFTSEAIEAKIAEVKRAIADEELAWMFENCFPNTLDTTVRFQMRDGRPDTFIITGDIPAMWLRDSTAQVWPYLPFAKEDGKLKQLLAGVVRRQTRCVLLDPYANAFNDGPTGGPWQKDLTQMKPELHERKWELDSLCYVVRLAHGYWQQTGDGALFDRDWKEAMRLIVRTLREQQRKHGPGPYRFQRVTSRATDTLPLNGLGNPTRPCGLIHSAFRPSDDACIYPLLIPSNLFAIVALRQLNEIFSTELKDSSFARECAGLADEVEGAARQFGIAQHLRYGAIWAYEVDGFGNQLFMDDANVPSLLSLPYLGCCSPDEAIYKRTRAFVLSEENPYFFRGTAGEGIGGPHVGLEMIWPLSIIMRALTSAEDAETQKCLRMLKKTHAGTGFMHESFHRDDPKRFTRAWFAWANTLFGELIAKLHRERPHVLRATL